MRDGLHEVRTDLPGNRISRVLFYIDESNQMVLLHGFIKKSRTTPPSDLELARKRQRIHQGRKNEK
jgi:phage-related protein